MCVCCMAVRGARGALGWEAQPGGCVLYGPSAAREAAPARDLGRCVSERSLTCRRVERAAHWQPDTVLARRLMRLCRGKRPRGARPSQVVVALFLELTMAQCAILRQWARHGFSLVRLPGAKIDAKRG